MAKFWKAMRNIAIGFVAVVALGAIALKACSKMPAVPEGFQDKFEYTGELEKKYAADGVLKVEEFTQKDDDERIKLYQIWYPEDLKSSSRSWPLVVMANGTGVQASRYQAIFRHLASWGFIVVGNEDEYSWDGYSSSKSLDFVLGLNQDTGSIFYGKVNTDAIGLAGHSQGGVAVFNAATNYDNSFRYKALYAASCTGLELAQALQWPYDVTKVKAPTLMTAGTLKADAELICKLEALTDNYNGIEGLPVMMGRIKDIDHGDVLMKGDAYQTAWFCYFLKGDELAGRCFLDDDAEMFKNDQWQDVQHKNL